MIRTPPRAVTRFLIPMIDVLILLLCVFLLTPLVGGSRPDPAAEARIATSPEALMARLREAEFQLQMLEKERKRGFEGYRIVVLDIDPSDGSLFATGTGGARVQLANEDLALRWIERSKAGAAGNPIGFLIRYPYQISGFPLRDQITAYRRWFRSEKLAIDSVRE